MIFFSLLLAHVPKYDDGCEYNCCHLAHAPETSQVAYLKGSGGIEYEIDVLGAYVDYNIVFREQYDTSTFSLYAGCGGCHSSRPFHYHEPLSLPLDTPEQYSNGKLEAFSPHSYYELLRIDGESPRFNTSALSNCTEHHFSIRLVVFDNATEDVVYGVVVGCDGGECERFTFLELLSFPIYAIRNHGFWNEASWTLPLIVLTVPFLMMFVLWWWHSGWLAMKVPTSLSFPRELARMKNITDWKKLPSVEWHFSWRCVAYAVAIFAIVVDLLETFAHFLIAARAVPAGDKGYGMFTILYTVKISFFLAVLFPWFLAREIPHSKWSTERCECRSFVGIVQFFAHGVWSILDIVLAVGSALLGAGFFLFPIAALAAGTLRFFEWQCKSPQGSPAVKKVTFARTTGYVILPSLPSLTI